MQAQQDLCVVGESRRFDYGIDWVRVKVVGPASVASGMTRHDHAVLAKSANRNFSRSTFNVQSQNRIQREREH
jgi:hypothetical protein